jgi:hypothetical protein
MKKFPIVLTVVALGAAGFAAASIAAGGHFVQMLTGTGDTVTTPTVTVATTTTSTTTPTTTGEGGGGGRRVTLCHHTGSKKHPFHTITVDQHAVGAHLRHGDTPGACPTVAPVVKKHDSGDDAKPSSHGRGHKKDQPTTTSTTAAPTTTTTSHGNGNGRDNGHGRGHNKSNDATTTTTPPPTTTTSDDSGQGNGHGNGNGNGNGGEALVIGARERFEIWSPERWEAYLAETEQDDLSALPLPF